MNTNDILSRALGHRSLSLSNRQKPAAFMCIKQDIAVVCAHCPDKKAADLMMTRLGYPLSHSICPTCKPLVLAQMEKDLAAMGVAA